MLRASCSYHTGKHPAEAWNDVRREYDYPASWGQGNCGDNYDPGQYRAKERGGKNIIFLSSLTKPSCLMSAFPLQRSCQNAIICLWVSPIEVSASERWWTVIPLIGGAQWVQWTHALRRPKRSGDLRPSVYIICLWAEILKGRAEPMDIILGIIAIISLCCSCFAVGYALGKDINKTQK